MPTFDDHDQVRKGKNKSQFAHDEGAGQHDSKRGWLAALALLVTGMGIPCIYHGTDQQFDGHAKTTGSFARQCSGANLARSKRALTINRVREL